ncbi:hypothetical protein [Mycobacterium marinum]|uniref:hypothetical protein n=1 Tax=Mycobacterium marinum TaxID=1781 RepID=UPI001FB5CD8B|nr:hypothetical protein [Mycobacterium marinum]
MLTPRTQPWLADHRIAGVMLFPGSDPHRPADPSHSTVVGRSPHCRGDVVPRSWIRGIGHPCR